MRLRLHYALLAAMLLAIALLYVAWLFRPVELPTLPQLRPPGKRPISLVQEFHAIFGSPDADPLVDVAMASLTQSVGRRHVIIATTRSESAMTLSDELGSEWRPRIPMWESPCSRSGELVMCRWYAKTSRDGADNVTFIGPRSRYVAIQVDEFDNVEPE